MDDSHGAGAGDRIDIVLDPDGDVTLVLQDNLRHFSRGGTPKSHSAGRSAPASERRISPAGAQLPQSPSLSSRLIALS